MKLIIYILPGECATAPVKRVLYALSSIIGLLVATCSGCASGGFDPKPKEYVLHEMQSTVVSLPFSPLNADEYVAWLDDRRVIFEGYERKLTNISASKEVSQRGLFVWEPNTGRVSRHTNVLLKSSMCVSDGFISYTVERDGVHRFVSGRFGYETEHSVERSETKPNTHFNRFTCEHYKTDTLPAPRFGGTVYPLRHEDGWLERVRGGAWLIAAGAPPKKLDVPSLSEGSIYPHKYSNYAKAYLFFHSHRSTSETWTFTSSGSIEMLRFPGGPWGGGQVERVRDGLVLRSKKVGDKARWDPGHAGLYLNRGARATERIVSGNVYAMAVSGDGCRIAGITDPWNGPERKHRLFAIDLCRKK